MTRKKIDELDDKIASLLAERLSVAREIISNKEKEGLPPIDSKREKEIIDRLSDQLPRELVEDIYERIFKEIRG